MTQHRPEDFQEPQSPEQFSTEAEQRLLELRGGQQVLAGLPAQVAESTAAQVTPLPEEEPEPEPELSLIEQQPFVASESTSTPIKPEEAEGTDAFGRKGNTLSVGEDDSQFLPDNLLDIPTAALRGVVQGGNELNDTAWNILQAMAQSQLATSLVSKVPGAGGVALIANWIAWYDENRKASSGLSSLQQIVNAPVLKDPRFDREPGKSLESPFRVSDETIDFFLGPEDTSTAGSFIRGMAQFTTGFLAANALLPGAGFGTGAVKVVTAGAIKGALADASVFDPFEERLADMLENSDSELGQLIGAAFSTDEGDSEVEARFKAALEGAIIGIPLDFAFHAFGAAFARSGAKRATGKARDKFVDQFQTHIVGMQKNADNLADGVNGPVRVEAQDDGSFLISMDKGGPTADPVPFRPNAGDQFQQNISGALETVQVERTGKSVLSSDMVNDLSVSPDGRVTLTLALDQADAAAVPKQVRSALRGIEGVTGVEVKVVGAETLSAAAIKDPASGQVFTGTDHGEAVRKAVDAGADEDAITQSILDGGDGFVTSDGRFVSREEGAELVGKDPKKFTSGDAGIADDLSAQELVDIDARANNPDDGTIAIRAADEAEARALTQGMNRHFEMMQRPQGALSSDQTEQVLDVFRRMDEGENLDALLNGQGTEFNFSTVAGLDEQKKLIEAISRVRRTNPARQGPNVNADGVQTRATTAELASGLLNGHSDEEVVSLIARSFGQTENLPELIVATRVVMFSHARQITNMAKASARNVNDPFTANLMKQSIDRLDELSAWFNGTNTNIGRAADANQVPINDLVSNRVDLDRFQHQGDGRAGADIDARQTGVEQADAADATEALSDQAVRETGQEAQQAAPTGRQQDPLDQLEGTLGREDAAAERQFSKVRERDATGSRQASDTGVSPDNATVRADDLSARQANVTPVDQALWRAAQQPDVEAFKSVTAGMTVRQVRSLARLLSLSEGEPQAILSIVRGEKIFNSAAIRKNPTFFRKLLEYRINALLSGPKTLVVNATSNAIVAFQRPLEMYWAGVISDNPALKQEGFDTMAGLWTELGESFKSAQKALSSGENILDPRNAVDDGRISQGMIGGGVGKLTRTPSRFLMATDEFFKVQAYRSRIRSSSLRESRAEGLGAFAMSRRLFDDMDMAFNAAGAATNLKELEFARVSTFTNDLGERTLGGGFQRFASDHEVVRLFAPFIRTPVNLFRFAAQRTPIANKFYKTVQAEIASGGERAAIARARVQMGGAVYATAALAASQGLITGAGPSNPQMRAMWLDAKFQPFSVRINGRWVSYRRLDPVLTPIGLVADFVHMSGELGKDDITDFGIALTASVASQVSSKAFMQDIVRFMDALSTREGWKLENALFSLGASFVPNALRQLNPDEVYREPQGFLEEVASRIPWASTFVEPSRNLFGEKVLRPPGFVNKSLNPFTVSQTIGTNREMEELVDLGRSFSMPSAKIGNIDLRDRDAFRREGDSKRQSPYDRMLEIIGEGPGGLPSLRTRLRQVMDTDLWKRANSGADLRPGGARYVIASQLIEGYMNAARAQIKREFPKLAKRLASESTLDAAAIGGGQGGVDRATEILKRFNFIDE